MQQDYNCADLLLLLPGAIPIPSFMRSPPLSSAAWVDPDRREFTPAVVESLLQLAETADLHPSVPFPPSIQGDAHEHATPKPLKRSARNAPLFVRHPSPDVYTPLGRQRILDSIGVPRHLHDERKTRILLVSFGGQVFKRPSPSQSRAPSPRASSDFGSGSVPHSNFGSGSGSGFMSSSSSGSTRTSTITSPQNGSSSSMSMSNGNSHHLPPGLPSVPGVSRIATPSHLYIPGSPGPISNPASPYASKFVSKPTPKPNSNANQQQHNGTADNNNNNSNNTSPEDSTEARLLPENWIAIVCGAGDAWGADQLPEGFYIAPKDIYMPDLTAVGDVLLGKLGYGTVSECVDACTPMIFGENIVHLFNTRFSIHLCSEILYIKCTNPNSNTTTPFIFLHTKKSLVR